MTEEEKDALHLYAINFRIAHTHHAAEMWQKLKTYVDRLVAAEREPLSDDEIKCIKPICADFVSFRAGVRHAEREHGIGENK